MPSRKLYDPLSAAWHYRFGGGSSRTADFNHMFPELNPYHFTAIQNLVRDPVSQSAPLYAEQSFETPGLAQHFIGRNSLKTLGQFHKFDDGSSLYSGTLYPTSPDRYNFNRSDRRPSAERATSFGRALRGIPYDIYIDGSRDFRQGFEAPWCFPAGVTIGLGQGGFAPIEMIRTSDLVSAFEGFGELVPARVTRLFRNITTEWLVLSNGLTVTPGHHVLNEHGAFEPVDALVARGGKLVRADGSLEAVTAERVVYADATRHLYEEAEEAVYASEGVAAPKPEIRRGWRTYNFEVEGLHTYVAGGVRAHNRSDNLEAYATLMDHRRSRALGFEGMAANTDPASHGPWYTAWTRISLSPCTSVACSAEIPRLSLDRRPCSKSSACPRTIPCLHPPRCSKSSACLVTSMRPRLARRRCGKFSASIRSELRHQPITA